MSSYEEYLAQTTSAIERLGDKFTTSDNRIDYVVKQLDSLLAGGISEETQKQIKSLADSIDILTTTLREQNCMMGETTQIRFQETLLPLTGDIFTKKCLWDAVNTSIAMHFPPGCDALVDVAAGHSDRQVYPSEGFLALDSTTPVFPVNELIGKGENVWAEIRNTDAVNTHTITVIFTLQRRL